MLESICVTEKLHWPKEEHSRKSVLSVEEKLGPETGKSVHGLSMAILRDTFTTGTSNYNVLLQSKEEKKQHSQKQSPGQNKKRRRSSKESSTTRSKKYHQIRAPSLSSAWFCTKRNLPIFIANTRATSAKYSHSISVAGNGIGLTDKPKTKASKKHYLSNLTKSKEPQVSKTEVKEDLSGRKFCILNAIKPSNLEKEKIKFFKSEFTYNPQFEYANPAPPNVLAKHSHASDRFLKQGGAGPVWYNSAALHHYSHQTMWKLASDVTSGTAVTTSGPVEELWGQACCIFGFQEIFSI
ncbi:hypothetical protein FKM82_017911 [Ascaphus truei]